MRTHETDICIVGGGMAGVAAAVSAARRGQRITLVERAGFLGGAATAGSVSQFVGWHTRAGRKVIAGIADDIIAELAGLGGADGFDRFVMSTGHCMDRIAYDPDLLKIALDRLMQAGGVEVFFHSILCGVENTKGRIERISVAGPGGLTGIEARCFLDTSGDMALLSAAGAEFLPEPAAGRQPATMMFALAPVDFSRLEAVSREQKTEIIQRGLETGALPRAALHHSRVPGSAVAWFNISRISVDAVDPLSLSAGEMEGREQAVRIARFLIGNLPGCEQARLDRLAPSLGVRDTRRVLGEHVLTADELRRNEGFADTIACGAYPIDIHHAGSTSLTIEEFGEDHYYRIPYRSLIPKGLKNLATAGRGLSAESEAFAAVRVMPSAMATGHAAGIAAAMVAQSNSGDFRAIDVPALQAELRAQSAFLGES
ncbi:FAD-dependent oxidoreductase [Zhengella mangrovi]|uniref:FAD-dependent oxidoreductase n=1 Tax=Zhengella mangrovi TaxID=1982044 RepID=UPI00197B9958|nr:FAD-dependent oxidoreductase [Zhengella mangrovi]